MCTCAHAFCVFVWVDMVVSDILVRRDFFLVRWDVRFKVKFDFNDGSKPENIDSGSSRCLVE